MHLTIAEEPESAGRGIVNSTSPPRAPQTAHGDAIQRSASASAGGSGGLDAFTRETLRLWRPGVHRHSMGNQWTTGRVPQPCDPSCFSRSSSPQARSCSPVAAANLDNAKVAASDLNTERQASARASRALTRRGSRGSRVLTLIQDVADGAGPAALPAYDDRIPEDVGSANVLGGLRAAASIINGGLPAVVRRRTTSAGELIVVRLLHAAGNDARYSFLMRRESGEWRIVYDSLLAEGLEA